MQSGLIAGAAMVLPGSRALGANETIRMGLIGAGGRGNEVAGKFSKVAGVEIAAIADPDSDHLDKFKKLYPKATGYSDLRKIIDDKSIDAVIVTTCNHWHCLAAIWAMQAGKDVYVEKPLSHSQWEGAQVVKASRKYNRIVQHGTQQRSDPLQAQAKEFLHQEKQLGKVEFIQVVRYGVRKSIGKLAQPLKPPASVDYNLWLGPGQDEPIYREKFHYDWHWNWNTGSGEMGNWGVHVLDDARNVGLLDVPRLPKRVVAGGGRIGWNDAGETPNVHFVYFDTGSVPVLLGLSNLTATPKGNSPLNYRKAQSGYVVHCEGGYYSGQRGGGAAYDHKGKEIKRFKGDSGQVHQQNFIDALRKRDRTILNAEIELGNDSTGWCNLANVAFRAGGEFSRKKAEEIRQDYKPWSELLGQMEEHMAAYQVSAPNPSLKLSTVLELAPNGESFVGVGAEQGNKFLKREYRKGFEVPEIV